MSEPVTEFPEKPNPLPEASKFAQRAAMKARKAFAEKFSPFVKAMQEAIETYLSFRKQGISRADAIKGLEHVLRETWPKNVSKFSAMCDACDDTGFEEHVCQLYARCGSKFCERKGDEHQHLFVRFCQCGKGRGFAAVARRKSGKDEPAESIGKVSKPKRGFSRIGS